MKTTSLTRWLMFGEWRAHIVQWLAVIMAIALGVAKRHVYQRALALGKSK